MHGGETSVGALKSVNAYTILYAPGMEAHTSPPAAPPRPSKAFASAVAPTHDPFLSDACVPYAIGARWQSVARDLEQHFGWGRTVCSDRVQPSDVQICGSNLSTTE